MYIRMITLFTSDYCPSAINMVETLFPDIIKPENIVKNPEGNRFSLTDQLLTSSSNWFNCREVLNTNLAMCNKVSQAIHGNWILSLMCLKLDQYTEKIDPELYLNFSKIFLEGWDDKYALMKRYLSGDNKRLSKICDNFYVSFEDQNFTYLIIPVKPFNNRGYFTAYSALTYILRNWKTVDFVEESNDFFSNAIESLPERANNHPDVTITSHFEIWLLLYFFGLLGYGSSNIMHDRRRAVNGPISLIKSLEINRVVKDLHYMKASARSELFDLLTKYHDLITEYIHIAEVADLIFRLEQELERYEQNPKLILS